MRNILRILPFLLFISSVSLLRGQDLHFSQYYNAQMNLNPALTGLINGDLRFAGAYRSQWTSVPVSYQVFSGAFDMRFLNPDRPNGFFGAGLHLYHDQAGDSHLSTTRLSATGSYTRRLAESHYLTFGGMMGVSQRAFTMTDLRWDEQYTPGSGYDPNAGTGENFENTNKFFGNFSAGANWGMVNPKNRSRLNLGGAFYNINQPNTSFDNQNDVNLYDRISLYAHGVLQLSNAFDLVLAVNQQMQTPHTETVVSGSTRIHLNKNKEIALEPGFAARFGDALIPTFYLHVDQWQFGLSYDANVSAFTNASINRGGPELTLIYTVKKVKPEESKICPPYL